MNGLSCSVCQIHDVYQLLRNLDKVDRQPLNQLYLLALPDFCAVAEVKFLYPNLLDQAILGSGNDLAYQLD